MGLSIEGPIGKVGLDLFSYNVIVCCAGGIGITPMRCIIAHLLANTEKQGLEEVVLVWAVRYKEQIEWFADDFRRCQKAPSPVQFRLVLYVTRPGKTGAYKPPV